MRLGITLPFNPIHLADAARRIEAAGFDSAWLPDAHNRGWLLPDGFTALGIAAEVAPRLEVGTAVTQVPLRPPLELAQRVATLVVMSGGRFCFGVGAGSTEADHVGMGLAFADRFRGFEHHLAVVDRLLRRDERDGLAFGGWPELNLRPPIVVGGRPGGRWFRAAAASEDVFNGWMGSMRSATVEDLCAGLVTWRAAAGERRALVSTIPNTLPNLAEVLAQYADAGFDDALVFTDRHDDAELERIRSLVS